MFHVAKLLCVAALAGAALAQGISIAQPAEGTKVAAGSAIVVQLERPKPSDDISDIAVVIGGASCLGGCGNYGLGHGILYNGAFDPKSTNAAGNEYQNFTVNVPNYFQGTMQLNVAHFYLKGLQNTAELESASTTVTIVGGSG